MPLVVVLHGAGATATEVERRYHWDPLADREHFVVAYPQALQRRWDDERHARRRVPARAPRRRRRAGSRSTRRGSSSPASRTAGVMTYRAGCALADRLAAIGPVAAWFPDCLPATPLSVVHIHGLEDEVLGFEGGAGSPAVPDGLAALAPGRRLLRGPDASDRDGEVTDVTWSQCAPGTAVELVTIDHGRHEWPGAIPKPGNDPVSQALDATATIWAFFAAHPRA